MYILIFLGVIVSLALSLLKVKHEIKKSQDLYKEFDEALEQNRRAFAEFNRILLNPPQNGSTSRLEARLVELYISRLQADYEQLQIPARGREIRFASFRESVEPRYEWAPQEFRSNSKLDYCESMAS